MPLLTETKIRAAKPIDKPYKLFDERGLFMLVTPAGGRLWRFRYRHGGSEKLLALGAYPDVPLKRAPERRDEARRLLADRIDPSAKRQLAFCDTESKRLARILGLTEEQESLLDQKTQGNAVMKLKILLPVYRRVDALAKKQVAGKLNITAEKSDAT